jgi:transcriptional regulator
MYVPPHFAETDLGKLQDFIERHSFGVLVSQGEEPVASHLPFLLDRQGGPNGTLIGHMARANPQWRQAAGQRVLVVFSGPHAYVSPTWYAAENVVPTWNYVAVHAYGRLRLVDDPAAVEEVLLATVDRYERRSPQPWSLGASSPLLDKLAPMIVAFQIEMERLEGKWKLSQNHPRERRQRAARALAASPDPAAQETARLMRDAL